MVVSSYLSVYVGVQSCHGEGCPEVIPKLLPQSLGVLYISAKHVLGTLGTMLVVRVLVFFLKCAIYCIALAMYLYINVF